MQPNELQRNIGAFGKPVGASGPKTSAIADIDIDRFERQKRLGGWDQERIANSKVLVVGAGALGNEIVKNLVLLGMGTIYLVDFDYVVSSNLSRCIFFRQTDSRQRSPKAEVVSKRAERVTRNTRIVPLCEDLENLDKKIYKQIDIALGGLDNLAARVQLNIDCYFGGVPLVDGGMEGLQGQVQVVLPPDTPCLCCSLTEKDWDIIWSRLSCTGPIGERKTPAISTTTSIIAAIQVQEALKILFGIESYRKDRSWNEFFGEPLLGKRLFYAGASEAFRVYDISRNDKCYVCGSLGGMEQLRKAKE